MGNSYQVLGLLAAPGRVKLSWLGLLVLLCWPGAYAQSPLATVTGVITDEGHAIIPGVTVTVRHVETDTARHGVTEQAGDFTITNLPPGTYTMTAEMPGFRTYQRTGIVLEVGQVLRNDIRLQVGAPAESVTVSVAVPALNTES